MALYRMQQNPEMEIIGLVTTFDRDAYSTSVHSIPENVIDRQVEQTGLPLLKMWVTAKPNNVEYEHALLKIYAQLKNEGVSTIVYGDIFLEDIKSYREGLSAKAGMKSLFPLWNEDTTKLMDEFTGLGFEAITCCVNTKFLNQNWLGRELNQKFFEDLPSSVDDAGENGEFHTFCFNGPVFKNAIEFKIGVKHFSLLSMLQKQENNIEFGYIEII